ncbi:MAG: SpoIIE family protein phosphatase [Bacteroidales bacterium]|mgnify:CR=1 FL=1|jgi:serine/threonine protein phosphatase PrpC|nr:SpoIIE family protein phosphatase [Bacteroidales bacterium]NLM91335.1 SpoIIE family protein phosphatase [Bacteroidales bacterium]
MEDLFFTEVGTFQKNHAGERICGDVFVSQKVKEENRTVVVLSDGMGHGVKANLLATLTATMGLNFTREHKDARKIAEIIMNTLPVCSERKISYATFSIVDLESSGQTTIINYDNPDPIVMRGNEKFKPDWQYLMLESENNAGKEIKACSFTAQKEDRIILMSDGITQSGLGKGKYLLGWGLDNVEQLVMDTIRDHPEISAGKLAGKIVNKAHANDNYQAKDDMSSVVIYFREPRQLLLCSGPPFDKEKDKELGQLVRSFNGEKILCGGSTADIISRELNIPIKDTLEFDDPDLPPISFMDGIDLVTEGILTLSKVSEILEKFSPRTELGKGPADKIVKMFLESDSIHFWIGTAVNVAHQDPNLPVELEIRRTVVKKIAHTLESKFLKEISIHFI